MKKTFLPAFCLFFLNLAYAVTDCEKALTGSDKSGTASTSSAQNVNATLTARIALSKKKRALFDYIKSSDLDNIRSLLEDNKGLANAVVNGTPAVIQAAIFGHLDVLKILHEKGADLNTKGFLRWNALHWAGNFGNERMVNFLLVKNEARDKNSKDMTKSKGTEGMTPHELTRSRGFLDLAESMKNFSRNQAEKIYLNNLRSLEEYLRSLAKVQNPTRDENNDFFSKPDPFFTKKLSSK